MKQVSKIFLGLTAMLLLSVMSAQACTSMLVSAKASASGRPMMWKNRDTGTEDNFVERVPATNGLLGYVALFNGGDSRLAEAWMGMNDAGFAIMNTASYNLAPDTARVKDREGLVMSAVLASCRTVDDFELFLQKVRKPLGVQANFGVMDANGGLAYFEVSDHDYKRFNVDDSTDGYLIRTNYSVSGNKTDGYGFIREANLKKVLAEEIENKKLSPHSFTEKASKSYYNAILDHDFLADTCHWAIDQDFIPRYSTSASIVIEGVNPGQPIKDMVMWTVLGYPPCSFVVPVTLTKVNDVLRPVAVGFKSPMCNKAIELKRKVFPLVRGNGKHYINMDVLRPILIENAKKSIEMYKLIYDAQTRTAINEAQSRAGEAQSTDPANDSH